MAIDNKQISLTFPSLTGDVRYRHTDFLPLLHRIRGKAVVDIGSHCGHLTLEIGRFDPKWLLAVEPFHQAAEVLEKQVLAYLPFPCQAIRCSMTSKRLPEILRRLGGCDVVFLSAVWQYLPTQTRGPALAGLLALTREHLAVRVMDGDVETIRTVANQEGFVMTYFSRLNPTNTEAQEENCVYVFSRCAV